MRIPRFAVAVSLAAALLPFSVVSQVSELQNEARRVVQRVTPAYPSVARRMNLAGTVKLIAVVAADGKVTAVEPVGGSPLLIQAAKDAVAKWKYAPAPAESREPLEFHFTPSVDR